MPADNNEKKNPKPELNAFGYILSAAVGFGMGYVFFSKRSFRGGYADRYDIGYDDVSPRQLALGTRHELEHTENQSIARRIALDHLAKDPDYYKRVDREDVYGRHTNLFSK